MNIPLVDLRANYLAYKEEYDEAIASVLNRCDFINGRSVEEFEREFADFHGVKHCIGLNSGTDALIQALRALGIGPGDEVITQANTFVATCLAITAVGATPVLVDVDPQTFLISIDAVEQAISERTRAVIPVHLYGRCTDLSRIFELAARRGIFVVEDTAQAHGAMLPPGVEASGSGRRRAGSAGICGCFSFYPGKNLGAFGDGGAVITNDDALAENIRTWRNWGAKEKYRHESIGGNSRLDTIHAEVLRVKLRHLSAWNELRRKRAEGYQQLLCEVDELTLPEIPADRDCHVWHLYVVRTKRRDELIAHLHAKGVHAGIHYPVPIHRLGAYRGQFTGRADLAHTEKLAREILSLPLFPELNEEQQKYVAGQIRAFFSS